MICICAILFYMLLLYTHFLCPQVAPSALYFLIEELSLEPPSQCVKEDTHHSLLRARGRRIFEVLRENMTKLKFNKIENPFSLKDDESEMTIKTKTTLQMITSRLLLNRCTLAVLLV